MADARIPIRLEIDAQHLARIIDAAVLTSTEVVNFHFAHLTNADLSQPVEPVEQERIHFRFKGPELNVEERRALHENWILAKAFQELLRAVRHALEEAYALTCVLNKRHTVRSNSTIGDLLKPFQSKAAGMKFPELLEAVNQKLEPKLDFAHSYLSLQIARNCLEHRGGIVSKIEAHGKNTFDYNLPRIKVFYFRNGEEIELKERRNS